MKVLGRIFITFPAEFDTSTRRTCNRGCSARSGNNKTWRLDYTVWDGSVTVTVSFEAILLVPRDRPGAFVVRRW